MTATLLAGFCFVLTGVIVGLAAPQGSLVQPFEGAFGEAPSEAPPAEAVAEAEAPIAPVDQVNDAPPQPFEQTPAAEAIPASVTQEPQAIDPRCASLTEAARQGYMDAGYATQVFASTAIAAKADVAAASKVGAMRDQYLTAMEAARSHVAEASRAQCWSKFGMEPPNLTAFASSLPSAAAEVLAR